MREVEMIMMMMIEFKRWIITSHNCFQVEFTWSLKVTHSGTIQLYTLCLMTLRSNHIMPLSSMGNQTKIHDSTSVH